MNPEQPIEQPKKILHKSWTFDRSNKIKRIIADFSIAERTIFYILVGVLVLSALMLLYQVNKSFLIDIPTHGGTLVEGEVGAPRFVNPLLALSDTDRDITALAYSGLMKTDANGNVVPDLASSYAISPDGLTYTFVIKNNATFQDGTRVTADDVVFTVQKAQDADLKSPKESLWNGVTVTKVDDQTVRFTLTMPYAPFIYNTTLGILPKHIWENVSDDSFPFSQFNTKPVGSGPYVVDTVKTDSSGLPVEYDLKANPTYLGGEPYITNIVLKMYDNEDDLIKAYDAGQVDAINSVTPQNIPTITRTNGAILTAPLERVFGIFFNQNQNPVFVNKEVRVALNTAVDKNALIAKVLNGYGTPLSGPLPSDVATSTAASSSDLIAQAQAILEKAGWTKNSAGIYQKTVNKSTETLAFSISTSDVPELKAAAEALQQTWAAMGAQVNVQIFDSGDLNQNVIRPRKYDALLFGEVIPPGSDLYPFWHSSERNDPGLNIALYTNIQADSLLQTLRQTTDPTTWATTEKKFESDIATDVPAVFLYAPDFIYIVPKNLQNVSLGELTTASDRFANISTWYINTESVWKIFAPKGSQ